MPRINVGSVSALEHQLREQFGDPSLYNVKMPLPPGAMAAAGRVVAAIAASDGALSKTEREALAAMMRGYGSPPEDVEAVLAFDPRGTSVESLIDEHTRKFQTVLLYDAMRVARVDGFHDKERDAAVRAATALGLDPLLVTALEAQLGVEAAVSESRARLLAVPGDHTKAAPGPLVEQGGATRGAEYGSAAPAPRDIFGRISKAIMVVAAGDGAMSEAELAWHVGQGKSVGMPDDLVEETLKFDPVGQRIEDYVDDALRPYARLIIFDAIRAASVDGYHDKERALAVRAAKALGLDDTFPVAVDNQIRVERAVKEARIRLLAPAAAPKAPKRR